MSKDKKRCILCKKTLSTNNVVPICKSCRKRGRDWTISILSAAVASVVVLEKQINKDK